MVAVLIDQGDLAFGAFDHLRDLRAGENTQDVAGDDGDKIGVVPQARGIVVPQILKAGKIRHLARRQK